MKKILKENQKHGKRNGMPPYINEKLMQLFRKDDQKAKKLL